MGSTMATQLIASTAMIARSARIDAPQMDVLMVFGFLSAFATIVCFLYQRHARSFVLALAICLAAMSAYGFMAGAWPLGIVEMVWSVWALARWRTANRFGRYASYQYWDMESRMSRMFGSSRLN
jgi:fluoride ion exporter CrcB/FEX